MHNSLKDKVLDAVDIVELIGERISLTRKGKDFVGLCPFHADHRPSLSVSPTKQIFKCWSCGAGGDAIKFVQMQQRVEFREALAILARRAGIELQSAGAALREELRRALAWARTHFQRTLRQPAGRTALDYARSRGISEESIERFELGCAADSWDDLLTAGTRAGLSREVLQQAGLVAANEAGRTYDRFRGRLIFPICDPLGRPIAFGGRALGDDPAKYLNSPESPLFHKSRALYPLHLARPAIERSREVIVVEGYIDALLLHQFGFANVVATLGTALTDAHVKLLTPLADVICMCFDSDEAGLRAAERAVEIALRQRVEVRVVLMHAGEDPADCVIRTGADGFRARLQSAVAALEFKWRSTLAVFHGRGERGKREALESFLQFVGRATLSGGVGLLEQGLLVRKLSDLLALPAEAVYRLLAAARSAARPAAYAAAEDVHDRSDYEQALRGLPAGLVCAVEEAFGLVLQAPQRFTDLDHGLEAGAARCEVWRRLHNVLRTLAAERGSFSRSDVLAACDQPDLCELISRACTRTGSAVVTGELCRQVSERVAVEVEVLRQAELRNEVCGKDAQAGAEAFRRLLETSRRRAGLLAAEHCGDGLARPG